MADTEQHPPLLGGATDGDVPAAVVFPPGGSRLAFEAEAKSSSPLAAAFLLGLTVPERHALRIADVILSGRGASPIEGIAGDDGSRAWEWEVDGVFVLLRSFEDGRGDAYCKAQKVAETPEAGDGDG